MPGCAITDGYEVDCNKDSLGGLSKIRIASFKDIESYTKVGGIITAITMATGKQFFDFQLVKSTSSFSNAITSNPANGTVYYAQTLTMVFNKLKATTSALVNSMSRSSLMAIAEDRNGEAVILGLENGLDLSGGTAGSGTAGGDRSGYELTFTGEEAEITHVDPTIIAALLVP